MGFPDGAEGKEPVFSVGDLSLIPGWEDPLEEGMATHSSILAWRIPIERGAWRAMVHGVSESQTRLSDGAQHSVYMVAQMVKNLPEMQETRIQSLGQEEPLQKGTTT